MPFDSAQLNTLILRVARGDASALDEVYALMGKRMFALARGIVKTQADAEDVVSDSFVKLAWHASLFKGGNGYAFLMRIVRNTAFDLLRRSKRTAAENIDEIFSLADERYSPEGREEALLLESGIKALPPPERRAIYYRYYLGLTVREIAKEEGVSKSAAERTVVRAEKMLKELLQAGQTQGE